MTHAKVSLKPWQPVRVWRNRTKNEQRRTITVYPCVETFPPGSEITLFEAPDEDGVSPTDGSVSVGVRGDSVALVIQPGNAVFVHIDLAKSAATSVIADITQEP
ncbi:MAG TPA: hypothetical protein VGP62_15100 [Bryobacteraceae bacterium]|jgi:hypothetical protein|nr:hypothetical protein [Bryobacteraceae bacterium]